VAKLYVLKRYTKDNLINYIPPVGVNELKVLFSEIKSSRMYSREIYEKMPELGIQDGESVVLGIHEGPRESLKRFIKYTTDPNHHYEIYCRKNGIIRTFSSIID
jgi:hypothetical protein